MSTKNSINNKTENLIISSSTSNSLLLGGASSAVSSLGAATNGQIPVGNTGNAPTLATITEGSNITVTNGAGTITIAASGGAGSTSAVLAVMGSTVTNVTGDNTWYTIIFGSEQFDLGSDYNNITGVFTAPVDGKYQVSAAAYMLIDATGGDYMNLRVETSIASFYLDTLPTKNRVTDFYGDNSAAALNGSMLIYMDAADTFTIQVQSGNNSKVDDVFGVAAKITFFSCHLVAEV